MGATAEDMRLTIPHLDAVGNTDGERGSVLRTEHARLQTQTKIGKTTFSRSHEKTTILIAACAVLPSLRACGWCAPQGHRSPRRVYRRTGQKGCRALQGAVAACHGEDLAATTSFRDSPATRLPPTGRQVSGRTLREDQPTMPALNPGSLTGDQTAELIALILSATSTRGEDGACQCDGAAQRGQDRRGRRSRLVWLVVSRRW